MTYGLTFIYDNTNLPEKLPPVELQVFKGTITSLNAHENKVTMTLDQAATERAQLIRFSYDPDLPWELYEFNQGSINDITLQKAREVNETHATIGSPISIMRDISKPSTLLAERIFLNI
jgi:hypothetical protein